VIREIEIWCLLAVCILALCCLFISIFNERISTIEWWLGDEEADDRPRGRLAFIRSEWFFYVSIGIFVVSALSLGAVLK
jgi:hypothetical protein